MSRGVLCMLRQDRWVAPYFRRYRWVLALALGLGVLASVLACLLMFISGWLIGAAARMPESIFSLMVPIALVQVVGIGKPIVAYVERLASHDWALRMTSSLRRRLFLAMERLTDTRNSAAEGAASGAMGAGDALALLNEDVAHVQNLYLRVVFPIVIAWATALLAVLALGAADALYAAWMALELFVVAAVLPAVSLAAGAAARMRRKQATTAFYQSLTDAVLGAADVAFAGRGADVLTRFELGGPVLSRACYPGGCHSGCGALLLSAGRDRDARIGCRGVAAGARGCDRAVERVGRWRSGDRGQRGRCSRRIDRPSLAGKRPSVCLTRRVL